VLRVIEGGGVAGEFDYGIFFRMGGRAVVLPFVDGRSTTRLIEEALVRGPA